MHPENPDGLLTSKDLKEIERIKEQIKADKRNSTNYVDESTTSDCEQLQNKLKEKRDKLEQWI